jgi:hypothetical protein
MRQNEGQTPKRSMPDNNPHTPYSTFDWFGTLRGEGSDTRPDAWTLEGDVTVTPQGYEQNQNYEVGGAGSDTRSDAWTLEGDVTVINETDNEPSMTPVGLNNQNPTYIRRNLFSGSSDSGSDGEGSVFDDVQALENEYNNKLTYSFISIATIATTTLAAYFIEPIISFILSSATVINANVIAPAFAFFSTALGIQVGALAIFTSLLVLSIYMVSLYNNDGNGIDSTINPQHPEGSDSFDRSIGKPSTWSFLDYFGNQVDSQNNDTLNAPGEDNTFSG